MSDLPPSWKRTQIGSICDVVRGSSPRPIADQRYFDGGTIPWIKIADATKSGRYLYDTREKVNEFGSSFSRLLPKGSLIVAASGTLGYTQMLGVPGCIHDGWLHLNSFRGVDKLFLYYWLKCQVQHFTNSAYGAAIQNINTAIMRESVIDLPPFNDQRCIASILSAYDDLIENNTRRIAILEEMARRIYEEWFVRFRFPGHDGVRMVDSELGLVPEGWRLCVLGDILENIRIAARAGDHLSSRRYVPIDCIGRETLALAEFKPWTEAQSSLVLFEEDDVLFGAMRAYFHKVCIAPFPGVTRTTCFVLRPSRPELASFGTLTAFAKPTVDYAAKHAQGATIPYAVWDGSLARMPILQPPDDLLRQFESAVAPMLAWVKGALARQNNLRETRDLLLPKLISGELDVSAMPEPETLAA